MPDVKQIPLCVPAADLGLTVDQLAERLGAEVCVDALGLRCCSPSVVRRLMEQREHEREQARQLVERDRAAGQRRDAELAREQAARDARAERQRAILADNPGTDALTAMKMSSDDDCGLAAAGRRYEDMMRGGGGHTFVHGDTRD
jgi:hypothetical protein